MSTGLSRALDNTSAAATQQRGKQSYVLLEEFTPEGVHFHPKISLEKQDGLACLRGVATALGIQAAVLILAIALWRLV